MAEMGKCFKWRGNANYTYCTGHEGMAGVCWWCGKPHDRKTQCCSYQCKQQYLKHFDWWYASHWALERAGVYPCQKGKCQDCGGDFYRHEVEVHHVLPINGGARFYSVLNIPCNLVVLCLACHNKTKRKLRPYYQEVMELVA